MSVENTLLRHKTLYNESEDTPSPSSITVIRLHMRSIIPANTSTVLLYPYNAEIFLYKPCMEAKGFFQFENIINVL